MYRFLTACVLVFIAQIMIGAAVSFSNYPSGNLSTLTDTLDIQYLALENNQLLYTEVAKYLAEQNDSCQLFREGLGYIAISNIQLGRKGRPIPIDSIPNRLKEIEVVFDVGISSFYPHQNIGMPLYYAFVNNRLVLIYSQQSEWLHRNKYSFKSQRKIKDLIASTLTSLLSPNFVFRGLDGNTFRLTSDQRNDMSQEKVFELGSFTLNKSKTITQHFDGSVSYQYP